MSEVKQPYAIAGRPRRNTSSLLINEPPLQVLPTLAQIIGVDEAIVLQQVHYWLANPRNPGRIDEQGEKWIYNTYQEWKENNFPFWSVDKIQRLFLSLEKDELIISAKLDASRWDMRKFYRINYDKLTELYPPSDDSVLRPSDDSVLRPSKDIPAHDVNIESETTTETNTEIPALAKISKAYESEIGLITAMIADELQEAASVYPIQWTLDAIHEAAAQNKRNWKYVLAILKRWKAQGSQESSRKKEATAAPGPKPSKAQLEENRRAAAEALKEFIRK